MSVQTRVHVSNVSAESWEIILGFTDTRILSASVGAALTLSSRALETRRRGHEQRTLM